MKMLSNIWIIGFLALLFFAAPMGWIVFKEGSKPPELPETMYDKEVDGQAVAALWNTQTGYVEQVAEELKGKLKALDARAAELDQVEERIRQEREELARLQDAIVAEQQKLDDMILSIEASEVKNLRSQATVYSNMEPDAVVQVLDTMDDIDVAKILYFMEPDIQSELFAAIIAANPEAAARQPGSPPRLSGAEKVARLNDLLKFTQPPEKKKSGDAF